MNREIIELREVVTKLVPMLTGKGLTVTQRGADAYVIADPKTRKPVRINIPNIPDTADAGFIRAIQGFIDHEVGHVLITDWDWVAGYRVTSQQMMEKKVQRLRTYHNIIEDTMIEREMERIFPGSKKNIADLRRHFIAKITKPAVASAKDEKEAFSYLLVAVMRALAGHTEFQDYMDDEKLWGNKYVKELLDRLPAKVKKDLPKVRTTKETLEIARILDGILHPIVPPPTITKVEPNQGHTPGGDPVEIHGTNFVDLEWVKFGGSLAKIVAHASGRKIVVETPPHAAGFVDVEVKTEHGQAVKASAFEYLDPPPQPGGGGDGDPDASDNNNHSSGEDQQQSDGESQDKPEKEAGEGDGDGERDHQDSGEDEPGDAGEGEKDESDEEEPEQGDGAEEDADDDTAGDGEGSDDAEGDGDRDSDEEGAEDEDPEKDEDEGSGGDEAEENDDGGEGDPDDDLHDGNDGEDQDGEHDGGQEDDDGDADDGSEEAAEASDGGDDDGEDASGQDEEDSDEDGKPGATEADEDDDGKRPGEKESKDRLAIQTDDHEAGEVGEADDEDNGSGGGVGNGLGKSLFDFDDNAFEKADLSSQIAILIANEAVDLLADNDYNVFTREFDRIEPLKVPEIHDQWVPDLEEKARAMTGRMSKDIERMMASQSHVVKVPGYRSGRLHSPALHRIVTNDDRLFNRKQEHKSKDTAVSLLIDNSGSMGGVKIVTAMVAGYALSSTLERVNIASEVIGFTTGDHRGKGSRTSQQEMNREISDARAKGLSFHRVSPIVMPIYKDFDERINATVKQRIAYMANAQRGMVTNVDGESLEYAAIRLLKRREKRKVMLVLSDGQPSGAANAAGHLKQTVEKLEKLGIDLVGIGIMDAAVRRFYTNHIVLQRIEDLPTQVMQELKKILTN
ncbi:cobaltochelatase CobT-related protein [Shinella zoogloeoides]|uniref:cobaltochelatase CobT-related protein n=1 Tax=Shinella zoogloeoides TaxID=352475 RepID=UPI00273F8242|nr:IPT/TIG domain-containing protein [Shinella zoogloeoides]WLR91037.1 IPT/TIG domain-containing protein [Shinella zoogloeoides]